MLLLCLHYESKNEIERYDVWLLMDVRYETVKIQKQSNIKEKFNVFTHVYLVFCHVFLNGKSFKVYI